MSPAQQAANIANAQHSTGPRTPEGKAASSQNATKSGLFSTRDFIRSGEESIYAELCESVRRNLAPEGDLECTLADEIRRAMWRLRRCGETEANLASLCASVWEEKRRSMAEAGGIDPDTLPPVNNPHFPDAMQVSGPDGVQLAVDRARAQSHRAIFRCTAELRKLQTERLFRQESFDGKTDLSFMGVAELRVIRKALAESVAGQLRKNQVANVGKAANVESKAALSIREMPATKQTREEATTPHATPRNAQCPCGSGLKYKRCCARKPRVEKAAA